MTEALKLALEALELANINHWWGSSKIEEAITAIKEALAQPAQKYELVTYGEVWSSDGETWSRDGKVMDLAQPDSRPWEGLTDAEIQKCYSEAYKITHGRRLEVTFARAIEAKLKEKNT
jgi:hypothetical protein